MRGHEEASGTKYVPKNLFRLWEMKDPIKNYERYLIETGVMNEMKVGEIRNEFKDKIESELKIGFDTKPVVADAEEELEDVFSSSVVSRQSSVRIVDNSKATHDSPLTTHDLRLIDAIKEGLHQSMQQHSNLILMGQDIAEYGGAFKITEGFVQEFGKERVRNTPLCESAIVGTALGLSLI
jgi:2-oxoisovalerate dehydrogenase E1 component